ncbi:hypothetical protein XELAEV_18026903mg [Xenopus laevis]|uniref:Uncharacterized protein n=1 Tax=Xenopus laevis TaxID=8355 RepID=A0A974CVB9_XENLA|nr:hypothetical protein XELAEV_18026903mg [Xenopus laevis]
MARRPTLEDSTAAILSLVSMLLNSVESERCGDEPIVELVGGPIAKCVAEPIAEPVAEFVTELEILEPTMEPLPCATTRVEPEWQYVYQGTFTPSERGMMIPACGVCDMEAPNALEDLEGVCSQCETHLWVVEKTRDKVSGKTIIVYQEIEGAPGVSAAAAPAPEPVPEKVPEPALEPALVPAPEGWHAPEVDVACRPDAVLISLEEEYFQHVSNSGTENSLGESQVSKTPMVVPGAAAPHVRSNSSESKSSSRKVLLSDSKPCGDLTVTIYTALAVPTPTPVIGHDVDWRKYSFNRLGPIAPIAPSIRDPPILEDDEDLLDKLMSSSVNSADESILEVPAQLRCQSKRSVVSEPTKSVCPKVIVPQTPSEPGESTQMAELYHYEWGKISLEREKNLLAAIPKPKEDNPLGPAPGWEEYEETPEAEHGPGPPTEVPRSFIAPPIIGPEEEKDFWVLPGRADPNVFTSVSRVQRVINFHVHRTWGKFMPYAPLWVYEKVAASYENWLIDEILRKEKMHHSCLTNPDKVRREQDWQYLRSIEKEWWYGRTILQNAVKSCGKYNPTKYFNLEVYLGDGQWVDKPHPKYYIPYEDTKSRFLHMI